MKSNRMKERNKKQKITTLTHTTKVKSVGDHQLEQGLKPLSKSLFPPNSSTKGSLTDYRKCFMELSSLKVFLAKCSNG